jgi:glycosyltransferase involved in cell wall biosynthesis
LRILHVLAPCEAGGLERVVQALAIGHQARGFEVHLAVVLEAADPQHPFLAPFPGTGVRAYSLPLPGRAYHRERSAVRKLIGEIRPHLVHTHGYRPDVVDAPVARSLGVPAVTTVHGFTGGGWKSGGWKNRFYEFLQRRAYRRFDAVVAVSQAQVEQLTREGVPRQRLHLLRNAGNGAATTLATREAARTELGVPADRLHVGWVGRVSAEKGLDVLIAALPYLADLPLTVSVVGKGSQVQAVQAQAAALGVAERVGWQGLKSDAARLFPAFDAFVLSSRTEGTPVVLFEAMAAGVPIVATCVGGVPEVVGSAEALLVPPDDPAALAAGIRTVFQDPEAAAARARAAKRRLELEFGLDPWLTGYEEVYRAVSARVRHASNAT